ncbi:hypothetical protein EV363DRAFT_1461654 [Boletus edulis]|nr:hypothetical protein EV363DRAFT_1461654 [Boletus edulis]
MCVAITDNDTREQFALKANWDDVLLLLCRFHMWQAWQNGLNRSLHNVPKDEQHLLHACLGKFLMKQLKDITTYKTAVTLYNEELSYFKKLMKTPTRDNPLIRTKANATLTFLMYFQDYLKSEALWLSWSPGGVLEVACRMGVQPNRIAKTTNHLEPFNGHLKNKFSGPYHHSGRLPHLDVWVVILLTCVLPDFFDRRDDRMKRDEYQHAMRNDLPSGSSSSSESSSDSDSSFAEEIDPLDEWDEQSLMEEMTSLSANLVDVDPDPNHKFDLESDLSFVAKLSITDDGKFANPNPESESELPVDDMMDTSTWDKIALDTIDILHNLDIKPHSDDDDDSADSDAAQDSLVLGPQPLPQPSDSSVCDQNNDLEAIALQDVLAAEDSLLLAVKKALCGTSNTSILDPHISPSTPTPPG